MQKISVCLAVYNGAKYIKLQLESILSQLKATDEVIVSDDGSTDDTLSIVRTFNDLRIRILVGNNYKNPIYNFENAIKHASGDIIFLADQDDFWLPEKVSEMLKALKTADIVVSNCYMGDENLQIIKSSYFEWRNSKKGLIKNLYRNSYLGCCIAFKRNMLSKILPFPAKIPMHDMWIGLIAELYYKPIFLDKPLMIYRRHSNNVTSLTENFKSTASVAKQISDRYYLIHPALKRFLGI